LEKNLNNLTLTELYQKLAGSSLIRRALELARDEDLGLAAPATPPGALPNPSAPSGDITSLACIDPHAVATLVLRARTPCTIAGLAAMPLLLEIFAPTSTFDPWCQDGRPVPAGGVLGRLQGPHRQLLALERTMLNLLSRLSGIATRTAQYAAALGPTSRARLYDTRKTTPGLRALEKYAVRCGGGFCHRLGLHDAMLIKDNHLAGVPPEQLADFVQAAAQRARLLRPDLWFVEVEVDSLKQLQRLLPICPGLVDAILLDNMTTAQIALAVETRDARAPSVQLEVSGNVTLDTLDHLSRTGVERISAGSITHHAVWVDIGLDSAEGAVDS